MNKKGDILWGSLLLILLVLLLSPATNPTYLALNTSHPYMMAFVKFMLLATMGELLAVRIANKQWIKSKGMYAKAIIWGIIGMMIVFMFKFYPFAVDAMMSSGYLPDATGFFHTLWRGFFVSSIMNCTFAIAFMIAHRISDTYIDMKADGKKPTIGTAVDAIAWNHFFKFVVAKTIPFFWIPAHTLTFLLPENYRVLFAAMLSIALGVILAIGKMKAVKRA